jgi:hypothetical protein
MRAKTMLNTRYDHSRRPRLGLTEVLLVAAILAFGAFTLINEGGQSLSTVLAGFEQVIRG